MAVSDVKDEGSPESFGGGGKIGIGSLTVQLNVVAEEPGTMLDNGVIDATLLEVLFVLLCSGAVGSNG